MAEVKKQFNAKANEKIAKTVSEFLKTRMEYTRRLLEKSSDKKLSFSEFVSLIKSLENDSRQIPIMVTNYGGRILYTDEEINELVSLVKESIEKYSITNFSYSEYCKASLRSIIREAIINYINNLQVEKTLNPDNAKEIDEKIEKLMNWKKVSPNEKCFGIDPRIDGQVGVSEQNGFSLYDSHRNLIDQIGFNGTKKKITKKDEDILIADDLYVGAICVEDENGNVEETYTVLLDKENGKKKKAIIYTNKTYPVGKRANRKEYIGTSCAPLNSVLAYSNLEYFTKDLYEDIDELNDVIDTYNGIKRLTKEEKEQYDKVIRVAADWWAEAVANPKFDNGDAFTSLFAAVLTADMQKPESGEIQRFKENLGLEILAGLIKNPNYFSLDVDYDPDYHLANAACKAGFRGGVLQFPWKTTMYITKDKVTVRAGYGAKSEVLYDANQKEDNPKVKQKDDNE